MPKLSDKASKSVMSLACMSSEELCFPAMNFRGNDWPCRGSVEFNARKSGGFHNVGVLNPIKDGKRSFKVWHCENTKLSSRSMPRLRCFFNMSSRVWCK